ncbi:MAG: CRISPR-associated endonuclease Cas6 [Bacteroidetes bacterium]|nr:CRISPR-associated endonuclease Cas6 [Bacteroidota bacterium]
MMISMITYRITPFLNLGEPREPYHIPGAEWLRDAVKGLMHPNSAELKSSGVDTSLFHNHNEQTSHNKPGYPLIIYHYTGGQFLVTGINEGAFALAQLMTLYHEPVRVSNQLLVSFSRFREVNQEIEATLVPINYTITNYLALNSEIHREYEASAPRSKITILEDAIHKHIGKDLFKHLGIDMAVSEINLTALPEVSPHRQTYKNHHYLSFNLRFSACLKLPDYLALGNGKAFGYGILEKVTV